MTLNSDMKFFKVEKYVLPKFDVKITAPDEVSIDQEEIKAEVCATYTYGQPVPGSVNVEMCRPKLRHFVSNILTMSPDRPEAILKLFSPCYKETKQMDKKGCATFIFATSTFTKVAQNFLLAKLKLIAMVEEEGTGISHQQEKRVDISYVVGKLSFTDTPKIYGQGSNVEGKVKAVYYNNTPIADMPVYLFEANLNGNIRFQLSYTPTLIYQRDRTPYYEYTVVGEDQGSVDIMCLVLSRGAIVMQGVKRVETQDKSVNEGQVSFKLTVSPDMAPNIQVIIYAILPSETVIAKSADFSVEKCFSHKVSLEFSPSSAVPGEQTTLQVKALPDSLCGVSAVDQSVLIKEPGKTLEADTIFNLLPVKKASRVPHNVEDHVECLLVRPRRYVIPYRHRNQRDDAHTIFQNAGMKMATNLVIRVPTCLKYRGKAYHQGRGNVREVMHSRLRKVGSAAPSFDSPIETVRTFFPETWIWDLIEIGMSGTKDVSVTVPDTITTWETEAFCLSSQGFGLAPRKEITVFQPFFLELSLPYSIIRGEHFELKATVFNYLSSCIMVTVAPTPSLDYTLTPLSGDQYTSCLCGGERKTLSWTMAPSALGVMNVSVTAEAVASQASCDNEIVSVPERGRIDVVQRSLIVKAEGTEMSKTYNWLLCPEGEALTDEMEIQLPENVIVGSARASLSVLATTLSVNVRPEANCTSKSTKLTLKLQSKFSGKGNSTNMVILDIKMLSGFVPDQESLKKLKGALLVDRVEQKEDHVLVYIQELPKDIPINHSLDLRLEIPVQNMKPAVVKIYDYYQPSDQAETEYTYSCVAA
ncbi:hypothetical protein PBY51_009978 [Eleginops maclovinus]|uniref:Alpha-2-macroglobulin-like n=1 Tax=Eleginops maclovinus TaxID=56733 RepID=A0AAN7XYH6_ELEMC|nr:hypothetical protein PBY51_009978 [Eleginops maclovinus]